MWNEPILHVDMDAFFVEVERQRDPALRDKAVAVGGVGPRGVIASASYEARSRGVRSAQPTAIARRNCPELLVVPPHHDVYGAISEEVFVLFRSVTPLVEGLSLDEAFLDVSGLRRHHTSPVEVGSDLKTRIRAELGLPASVGVAATKFVAKLASEAAKPDGLRHVTIEEQKAFLHGLPVTSLWGVGPATLAALERLGIVTVADLAAVPEAPLVAALGPSLGRRLHELSNGIDARPVEPDSEAKSISVEETYAADIVGRDTVETAILSHANRLSGRLRRAGLAARTVTLKVRYEDFSTVTRSRTLGRGIDGTREIYRTALELLDQCDLSSPIRLLGLGGAGLAPGDDARQLGLDSSVEWDRVEDAVASLRERYGEDAVRPARLLNESSKDPD